jgi:hypothetical protein
MEQFFTIVGLIGAVCMVGMYLALERGWTNSKSPVFYAINGIGAFLVTVSLTVDFDPSDLGGIATEGFWFLISAWGFYKYWKARKKLHD